ncbi:MAG: glycosyltransferase family 39 protein [Candidatus Omnitrophica bacterium]|nr:glycosyltransferase family 39 protein [Candidatus Omnitrophota bacterium]
MISEPSAPSQNYRKFFFFLTASILLTAVFWCYYDNSIRGVDSPNHLFFSLEFFYRMRDILQSPASLIAKGAEILRALGTATPSSTVYWPNGLYAGTAFFYYCSGPALFAAKLSMIPYLIALIVATYLIGMRLFSEKIGLLAAAGCFFYPLIFQSARQYQLDLPLTAMVACSVFLLLASEQFNRRSISVCLGISCGWAMLIKGQFLLFIIGPLAYYLYAARRTNVNPRQRRRQYVNFALFLVFFLLIASIWWGGKIRNVLDCLTIHVTEPLKALEMANYLSWEEKYSIRSIAFYIHTLALCSLRPFFSAYFSYRLCMP